MPTELAQKTCKACAGSLEPLKGDGLRAYSRQIDNAWNLVDEHHLEREFKFGSYDDTVEFANKVADIAKSEDHHPDVFFTYGKARVTIWTHKVDGLTESDFVFAAKVDAIVGD